MYADNPAVVADFTNTLEAVWEKIPVVSFPHRVEAIVAT